MLKKITELIERYERWLGVPLLLFMSSVALLLALMQPAFLESIERRTLDQRFVLRGAIPHDPHVVVLAIDNKSVTEVGRWPWSRDKIATIVDRVLGQYGAKVLGFDIIFSEKQRNPLTESLRMMQMADQVDPYAANWLYQHQQLGDVDGQLEAVFTKYHDKIAAGYFFYGSSDDATEIAKSKIDDEMWIASASAYSSKVAKGGELQIPYIAAIEGNMQRLSSVVDAEGFFNFFPDQDGMVRKVPLMVQRDGLVLPNLGVQSVAIYLNHAPITVDADMAGVNRVTVGSHTIPTDAHGAMLLNHYGPGMTFTHISAADVLADRVDPALFKDALVLFGATAIGIFDMRPTPFDEKFPGVENHAAGVNNILHDEAIERPAWLEVNELVVVFLLSMLLGLVSRRRSALSQSVIIITVPLLLAYASLYLFTEYHLWVKITYIILGVLMTTIPTTLLEYVVEAGKRSFITDAFSRYLSPELVEDLANNPDMLKLGGEERVLTAFFSDIASFSSFSEKMTPTELVSFLNEYLSVMSNIILDRGGTIDKYEGDAIIAFFGAPLPMEDHAYQCTMASLEQQWALSDLRNKWREEGLPEVNIRIGLNSGAMVVGNMGAESRMNYTMMGDHVNLAARLEGVGKQYRVSILVSGDTRDMIADRIYCRFVDRVRVVGRSSPVELMQPINEIDKVDPVDIERDQLYQEAWSMMQRHEFAAALKALEELDRRWPPNGPQDGLYQVMIARVRDLIATPPPSDWDGVHNLTSK
ncbi:MAG: adenylate/guanylate cyclase domain-containing protein [Mariprofundales bacterium]|nr:adenylate/guanylate cyclase domain-containing protein [Mariprofundales bacterium]